MPKKGPKRIDADLDGFADVLNKSDILRTHALKYGKILSWPSAQQNGVMSFDNLAGNHEVMKLLIEHWASQYETPIMIPVDTIKYEVGGSEKDKSENSIFSSSLFDPFCISRIDITVLLIGTGRSASFETSCSCPRRKL